MIYKNFRKFLAASLLSKIESLKTSSKYYINSVVRKRKDPNTSYFKSSFSEYNEKFILVLPFFAKLLWQYWIRFSSVFLFYLSDLLTLEVKIFVICYVSINLSHALVSSICIEIRKFNVLNRKLVGI